MNNKHNADCLFPVYLTLNHETDDQSTSKVSDWLKCVFNKRTSVRVSWYSELDKNDTFVPNEVFDKQQVVLQRNLPLNGMHEQKILFSMSRLGKFKSVFSSKSHLVSYQDSYSSYSVPEEWSRYILTSNATQTSLSPLLKGCDHV
jgi:hypothetical protein